MIDSEFRLFFQRKQLLAEIKSDVFRWSFCFKVFLLIDHVKNNAFFKATKQILVSRIYHHNGCHQNPARNERVTCF